MRWMTYCGDSRPSVGSACSRAGTRRAARRGSAHHSAMSAGASRDGASRKAAVEVDDHVLGVAHDRHVGDADLGDLGRVDVDVHDLGVRARTAPPCRSRGRRSARRATTSRSASCSASTAGTVPCMPGMPRCCGCESGNAPRAMSVVTTGAPVVSASVEQLGGRLRADHAAADVEHRLLRLGEQLRRGLDLLAVRLGDRPVAGQVDLRRPDERRRVLLRVLRDVDEHRAGATGAGDVVRRGDRRRDVRRRPSRGRSAS